MYHIALCRHHYESHQKKSGLFGNPGDADRYYRTSAKCTRVRRHCLVAVQELCKMFMQEFKMLMQVYRYLYKRFVLVTAVQVMLLKRGRQLHKNL